MNSFSLVDRGVCPLCGSCESSVHIAFPDIPVVKCAHCGFMYSAKVLSEQDLNSYYRGNYGGFRHLQGQIINATINSEIISRFIDMTSVSRILDVGAGYGFLLQALVQKYSVDAVGVELSQQESEYAVEKLGLRVSNVPLGEAGLPTGFYDLVTIFEVIEHIRNPLDFISEVSSYVKPGGYMLILTDNFCSSLAKSLGPGFPKWIPHMHISHFSPETLKSAIESTKTLTVVKSMYYTPWEIIVRDIYYKFRGIKKNPSEAFNIVDAFDGGRSGSYRLFQMRKLLNRLWVQHTLGEKMDGDMMYFLAQKTV